MLIQASNLLYSKINKEHVPIESNYSRAYNPSMSKLTGLNKDTVTFTAAKTSLTPVEKAQLDKELDHIERQSIKFFIDHRLPNGLVLDRAPNSDIPPTGRSAEMCSVAATGYSLTALVLAVEKNMLPKKQAKEMVMQTLKFIDEQTPKINGGWLAHFMDAKTGETYKNTEISSIDTALFYFNAFAAAEYFDKDVKKQVEKMYNKIDFNMMLTSDGKNPDQKAFNLGFHVENGEKKMIPYLWNEYSEGVMVPLFALGNKNISEDVWTKGWDRSQKWEYKDKKNFVCLPLFTYYYIHGFFNLKDKTDKAGSNFWKASEKAVDMQMDYCKDKGYPDGLFGITACDGPNGYQAYQPAGTEEYPAHDGTIAPPAILACLPFKEKPVYDTLQKLKKMNLTNEKYGLTNAYNVKSGWKTDDALGIDIGSTLLMIDNYRTGNLHKLIAQNSIMKTALERAGLDK